MHRVFACVVVFALATASISSGGTQRVSVKVSPTVALEPALLTVRTTVEPSEDNRFLSVALDSENYSTASEIPLHGLNASRLSVLEFREVPSGVYEVSAVVVGARGPLASTTQIVRIQPAFGRIE
jgi:hypothetical protein